MLFRSIPLRNPGRTSTQLISRTSRPARSVRDTITQRQYSLLLHLTHSSIPNFLSATSSVTAPRQARRGYSTPMAAPTDTAAEQVANNTGITPDTLAQTLREKLEATHVEIQDISGGCGASFTALIVSPQFQGKAALARHRLVNGALKAEIAAIHAWTPKCLTPEQWEQQQKAQ